jgi:hypothetical protein
MDCGENYLMNLTGRVQLDMSLIAVFAMYRSMVVFSAATS